MTNSTTIPSNLSKIAHTLKETLKMLGVENVDVQYSSDVRGLQNGFIFIDEDTNKPLTLKELNAQIKLAEIAIASKATSKNSTEAAKAKGELQWLTSFNKFVYNDRTEFWIDTDYNAAMISKSTALDDPFSTLLANSQKMEKLTPINWDLSANKKAGVVKALNNIARMDNITDIEFSLDKSGKIVFSSKTIAKDQLGKFAMALMGRVVSYDKNIDLLDKEHLVSKMVAFKHDRDYIAIEKETGFDPKYLVDMIENAQIGMAAERYLRFDNVRIANQDGIVLQGKTGTTKTEDGTDIYYFTNANYDPEALRKTQGIKETAPIPRLPYPTGGERNWGYEETIIKDTLDKLRGSLPVELSPDTPEAPKTHGKGKAPAVKVLQH